MSQESAYIQSADRSLHVHSTGHHQNLLCALHFQSSEVLAELLKTKLTALPKPCQKAQRTLRNHREEIERSFEQPYNNGSLEGTNNVIKTIKRVAFGFWSLPNFRLRILLVAKSPYFNVKTATWKKAAVGVDQLFF